MVCHARRQRAWSWGYGGSYFSDFDRNFCFGRVDESVAEAYAIVYRATDAGLKAARPGITAEGLWKAMADVLSEYTSSKNAVGRLGHGLGMQAIR